MVIIWKTLIILYTFTVGLVENANILGVFQAPAYSHQFVYRSLIKELADRGHTLTVLTPNPGLIHPNITEISLESSYKILEETYNFVRMKEEKISTFATAKTVLKFGRRVSEEQLRQPAVKELIASASSQHFDLVIVEYFSFTPILAFAELFDCPAVGITSMDTSYSIHEQFGNPANPVIHPDALVFSYEHTRLNFFQRLVSFILHYSFKFTLKPAIDNDFMEMISRHFPNVSATQKQLEDRVAIQLVNVHPLMGATRPVVPKVVQLGFLHIKPAKSLPEGDIKTFLDKSSHGLIYMSFGTCVRSKDLSNSTIQMFLNVFSKLKYDVLWKYEADELPSKPSNVMIRKWLPQADILAHPKIKLVLCQAGQQTTEEAIDREVPLLVIPFIEEQEANADKIVRKEIGQQLNFHSLSEEKLIAAIYEVLKPKYKRNIQRLKRLVNDQPMTSLEKAVWWTEYVIRHKGAKHLEYTGRSVPFYQQYWLDIFSFLAILLVVSLIVLKFMLKNFISTNKRKHE